MDTRMIDAPLHGAMDYSTGALLQVLPKALDLEGTDAGRALRVAGAVHGGYSLFTDYELGAVKAIPFPVHLKLDTLWALALGAAPFVTGDWKKGRRHWLPHVLLAAYELGSIVMTDPGDTNTGDKPEGGIKRTVDEAPSAFPNGHPTDGPRFSRPEAGELRS